MKKIFILFILILCLISLACTGPGGEPSGGQVTFLVTQDFGRQEIFSQQVQVQTGESALEALQRHLDVQTEYGGRFVTAIEGLASTQSAGLRHDWFFYANGITAAVGAGDYYPREGDIIWWDYHAWGDRFFTPAVTGAFPQPFLSGYRGSNPGTVILYTPAGQKPAESIQHFLREEGAARVRLEPYGDYDLRNPREMVLVLALWPELAEEPFWQGMVDNREKVGWFARLTSSAFFATRFSGDEETYPAPAGALLVSASGLGDPNPIWLLTALDEGSLKGTAALLIENPRGLRGTFGLLFKDGELIRLPR